MKKIIFIILLLPILVKGQHVNLLNTPKNNQALFVKHVITEKDSVVFTGLAYKYDSIEKDYYKNLVIGKMNNKGTANRVISLIEGSFIKEITPMILFVKPYGYSLITKVREVKGYFTGETSILILNLNNNLQLIDSSKILFSQNIFTDTLSKNGTWDIFFETTINSSNNYVFTILSNGTKNLKNTLLEVSEKGEIINNKAIVFYPDSSVYSTTIPVAPIICLEESNINDSIKYVGFNGNSSGGLVYLDSLFNVKKVTNFLIGGSVYPSEYKFVSYIVKTIKLGNDIVVAGPGDSIVMGINGFEAFVPSFIIKKIRNGAVIKTICLQTNVYEGGDLNNNNYQHNISYNSKHQILVNIVLSFPLTYVALLDSNLNLLWERLLHPDNPWGSGLIGATPAYDANGFYFYGLTCVPCTLYSTINETTGFIGYLNQNGFSLNNSEITLDKKNNITVYPNPATKQLTITSEIAIKEVFVYDLVGKLVKHIDLLPKKETETSIPIDELKTGIYIIQVIDMYDAKLNSKFIKE